MSEQVAVASESNQSTQSPEQRDRTMARLREFMQTESASAGLLVAASVIALLWANSPWSEAYVDLWHTTAEITIGGTQISMDLHHWVNDALMVLFFFVIGLEVRREFAIGELTERRRIVVPLVAGIGGMLVPAAIYLALNPSGEAAAGWGAVIGTDTAFLLGVLALVGPRISTQLRIFLLTLTVIDDVVAVSVIGIVYTDEVRIVPLVIAAAALVGIAVLDKLGQWRASPYVFLVLVAWLATLNAGLHASIAGMVAGLLVPAAEPARSLVEQAARRVRDFRQSPLPGVQRDARAQLTRAVSINERLQEALHGWAGYVIVPVFALANAGVDLRGGLLGEALRSPVTWGVVLGLVAGKLLGIWLGSLAAVRAGWGSLPQGVGLGHVAAGGALSGIGFTVSLLIIGLAFDDGPVRDQATVGVLLSVVVASAAGWLVFRFAAKYLGQTDAALPTTLSVPVDPDVDHVRGPHDAPMTLVEYLDYECPFCAKATGAALEVKQQLGDRLRYVVRHLPLDVHPQAWPAALAVEAAGRQGRFWEMHDLLFRNQDELEVEDLAGYAAELGLDVEDFLRDMDDDELVARVRRDLDSADESGARGTPTFFIGDERHEGAFDARTLVAALEASALSDADRGYRRIH